MQRSDRDGRDWEGAKDLKKTSRHFEHDEVVAVPIPYQVGRKLPFSFAS